MTIKSLPALAEAIAIPRQGRLIRDSETLLVVYFTLSAARAAAAGLIAVSLLDLCAPLLFLSFGFAGRRIDRKWLEVLRDWAAMPFLLLAYWNAGWLAEPAANGAYEQRWIVLDRLLLNDWGGRRAIECCGAWVPGMLESAYLILYAVPPILLGLIYLLGRRRLADHFLFTLFAGALTTYALLPLFPVAAPRHLFRGEDLPTISTMLGRLNLWLLDTLDIREGVFPSGHVTVAFSAAFGFIRVLPERRWMAWILVIFAVLVSLNTVYARYHYAVDGLAGLAISFAAWRVSGAVARPPAVQN